MFENYPDILNVEQLCGLLHICRTTALKYLHTKDIPHRKIGRKYFIAKSALIAWLNDNDFTDAA